MAAVAGPHYCQVVTIEDLCEDARTYHEDVVHGRLRRVLGERLAVLGKWHAATGTGSAWRLRRTP